MFMACLCHSDEVPRRGACYALRSTCKPRTRRAIGGSVVVALLCGLRLVARFAQGTIGVLVRLFLSRAELVCILRLARIGFACCFTHGSERPAGAVLLG